MRIVSTALVGLLSLALLAGCLTTGGDTKPSPAALAYATKNSYEAALIVAVRYNELPRCGKSTSPPLCSDQAAVETIRKANAAARVALDKAEKIVRDPALKDDAKATAVAAAVEAVDALKAILTIYAPKGGQS